MDAREVLERLNDAADILDNIPLTRMVKLLTGLRGVVVNGTLVDAGRLQQQAGELEDRVVMLLERITELCVSVEQVQVVQVTEEQVEEWT